MMSMNGPMISFIAGGFSMFTGASRAMEHTLASADPAVPVTALNVPILMWIGGLIAVAGAAYAFGRMTKGSEDKLQKMQDRMDAMSKLIGCDDDKERRRR